MKNPWRRLLAGWSKPSLPDATPTAPARSPSSESNAPQQVDFQSDLTRADIIQADRQADLSPELPQLDPIAAQGWVSQHTEMMGTRVSVALWHAEHALADHAATAAMAEFARINAQMSVYRDDSEISALNRTADQKPFAASAELFQLIQTALLLAELSRGAFDITFDGVGQLYDLRRSIAPTEEQRAAHLHLINYRAVELNPSAGTVYFHKPGMRLNLGGIGKGYAVERAAQVVKNLGITHALLNAGGDSRVIGDRRGTPWIFGIRDPRAQQGVIARLPIIDEAISTAGDYERYFDRKGERIHHILNPQTGAPTTGVRAVTVIGPDATMTDGLDTAIMVMGVDAGMAMIAKLPEYEALIVDEHGRLVYSSGLATPN